MTPFEITILGNNSAIPANGRHPSAQFLNIRNQSILVDCGEGTQIRLREVDKANIFHLSHIFISHLHGDHFLGLVGLLSTLSLMRREKELHIYAHSRLKELIDLNVSIMGHGNINYPLVFHDLPEYGSELICDTEQFKVTAFQLEHRIPCCGFRFEEVFNQKKVKLQQLESYQIPKTSWKSIQKGADYTLPSGEIISNDKLTLPNPKPRSYAYCADTIFTRSFLQEIKACDTAYIESTYTNKEADLASDRFHCTAQQAAQLAKEAEVGRLLLGHFSSRYSNLDVFQEEARDIFKQTELALEGKTFSIELW